MIEVLAAMVIFSSSAVVLFSWVGQTAARLNQLKFEQSRLFAELDSLEYARGINPMREPTGTVQLGELNLSWTSEIINAPLNTTAESGGSGDHEVALYRVKLTSERLNIKSTQELFLVGWKRVRESKTGVPFDMR
ncbi:type II secretory pathway pseudopilin PulG [Inhella inkyongensis]|uniref:Type II secretory pathway pseudopilin PulG n=2 Tax=Inhella inkyongensis TaxID=392593 RepID=A0A840S095_9BURK|nr:type II secretory pathway pseudopilin PulG [Inhella inkyongensis]